MGLPRGCSFERSKAFVEGRTYRREFYDEEGNVIHEVSHRACKSTGIEVSVKDDPTAYHREYYRRVRRYRDGRKPRDISSL